MLYTKDIAAGLINAEDHEWQEKKYFSGILGVRSKKGVWFWFKLYPDMTLIFDHAYSQINGSTKKDWRAMVRGENLIKKLCK